MIPYAYQDGWRTPTGHCHVHSAPKCAAGSRAAKDTVTPFIILKDEQQQVCIAISLRLERMTGVMI